MATEEINHQAAYDDGMDMPMRSLEKRCARAAAKAGKYLTSARAVIEPEIGYFLALRERMNAQGKRGGIEGWQSWCEKHFSCDVRTVNRTLSAILGPEKPRPKSRKWRKPAEALIAAVEPAIRLARKYPEDPDAEEFLDSLESEEDLQGLVPEPQPRPSHPIDEMRRYKRVKTEELYRMGLRLAHAVIEGSVAVHGDISEGKKIIGLAKHMLEIESKAEKPQDNLSRSPGENFVVPSFEMMGGSVEGDTAGTPSGSGVRSPDPAPPIRLKPHNKEKTGATEWIRLKVGTLAMIDGIGYIIHSVEIKEQPGEHRRPGNYTSHDIAMTAWSVGGVIHAKEESGWPLCRRGSLMSRLFGEGKGDYLYAGEGEEPSCEACLATKAKAVAAAD